MDQLNASNGRLLQPTDLPLHQQLKRHLRDKEGRPGPRGIADGRQYVHGSEAGQRVDGVKRSAKRLVEDVADPGATASKEKMRVGTRLDTGELKVV